MEFIKKLDNLNIYLIAALPFALATGPAIIEIFVFLIISIFFLTKKSIKFDRFDYYILLFYVVLVISSLLSSFKLSSLSSSFFLIRFIILYFVIKNYFTSEHRIKIINLTFIILCIVFIILIVDGYYQYFLNLSLFGTELSTDQRMIMHLRKDEFIMGSYFSKMIPIFLSIWFFKFNELNLKKNLFLGTLFILTFYCMVLSGDRAATFLSIGYLIGLIILYNNNIYYKFLSIGFIFIIIFISLIIFPSVKDRYIDQTIQEVLGKNDESVLKDESILRNKNSISKIFNLKKDGKNIYIFSTAHESHIRIALSMFLDNPLIGVGPNNFRKLCSDKKYVVHLDRGCTTHPHHILSQILAETGILGFIFYLIVLLYIMRKLFTQLFLKNLSFNQINLYSFYFVTLIPFLPSGNIFNNWYIYSLFIPFIFIKILR